MMRRLINFNLAWLSICLIASTSLFVSSASLAQEISAKPYDQQLYRLSELLGAIHYLRELCVAKDGQKWRDSMRALIEAEGTSAARKARLSRHFNRGYRGYSRSYRSCTPSAQETVERFMAESIEITGELVKFGH